MNIIEVKDLSEEYSQLLAFDRVTFDVRESEIFGFLRPNGACKTTTINMLCTLLRPTSGSALFNGFDIVSQRAAVRRSVDWVFQEPTLDVYLTA